MAIKTTTLKLEIETSGQRYVDRPRYAQIATPAPMASAVNAACGINKPIRPIEAIVEYEREVLRWKKPDGKGGLVPR